MWIRGAGVDPTLVIPAVISPTEGPASLSYRARNVRTGDVLLDQRRQSGKVSLGQASFPVRRGQGLQEHEGVDVDHAVLDQVQRNMLISLASRRLPAMGTKLGCRR
jgi:hypothetical protein